MLLYTHGQSGLAIMPSQRGDEVQEGKESPRMWVGPCVEPGSTDAGQFYFYLVLLIAGIINHPY